MSLSACGLPCQMRPASNSKGWGTFLNRMSSDGSSPYMSFGCRGDEGGLKHPLPPPKVLLKATLPHLKFWQELLGGKMAFLKKILTFSTDIFQKIFGNSLDFHKSAQKFWPLPLKTFLNSYPPPLVSGQVHVRSSPEVHYIHVSIKWLDDRLYRTVFFFSETSKA